MASNPWAPVQPSAAALLIERCLRAGVLSQDALDQTRKEIQCFSRVEELEKISALKSEIDKKNYWENCFNKSSYTNRIKNEQDALDQTRKEIQCFSRVEELEKISALKSEIDKKSLELEMLSLEKETADITHSFFLNQKCDALQTINSHLEAVMREKSSLRQRLAKPLCQEHLPIEASYHQFVSELLPLAVKFIEKLEVYIQTIRTIPQIPECVKNMDNALIRMEAFEADLEEVTKRILTWREKQMKLLQGDTEESSRSIKESTSYLTIDNLRR